jgi:AraC family ethanolamine operon transcriptional activator
MLAAAIRNANLKPYQLSARPSPSQLAQVVCPRAGLDIASLGPAMLFTGGMPRDCFTLCFVRACSETGHSFNFGVHHTDGYMGFFPPGGALDATTPSGFGSATLTVPEADFRAALVLAFPEIPEAVLARGAGMRVGEAEQARLSALLSAVEGLLWQPGDRLVSALARQNLERDLLEVFFAALRSGCDALVPKPGFRMEGRHRRLRQARDYLAAHAGLPIGLDDLCSVLGLSHRGVQYLFRDLVGLGPIAYLRHQRLHSARRALRRAAPGCGAVKRVALESGFWHFGHFAHEYRVLFGEPPSETLARTER